ncbi:MAG: beta-ketoacyl-ACP synthase II [Vicinamibacterales bacterium]
MRRRAVITGIGLVTPLGLGTEPTWEGLIAGRSGIGPITQFDAAPLETRIAGEVKGFDPARWMPAREVKFMDRFIHLAISAGSMSVEDAGLGGAELGDRAGCYLGVGLGGAPLIERTHVSARERGWRFGIKPWFVPAVLPNMAAGALAVRFGITGPVLCHATACASGAHALGEALRAIQRGDADIMLAGGSESAVNLLSIGGFGSLRALSRRNDRPEEASRPFDLHRDGFVLSEGAGVLVLEERERARARGARMYAELAGYGLSNDAAHATAPRTDGKDAARAMGMALSDAATNPEDVQYLNAHGTATQQGDPAETLAIRRTFREAARRVMVSSTKSMLGHMLGGSGAVEAGICALVCERGVVPPTINLTMPDPACDLDYVPNEARDVRVGACLSNSFGFGGVNASLVFKTV